MCYSILWSLIYLQGYTLALHAKRLKSFLYFFGKFINKWFHLTFLRQNEKVKQQKKEIYNSPQKYSISFIRAVKHAQRQWWYNLFLEFNMCGVHREPRRKLLTISVFFKPSYRPSKHLLAFKPFQLCALVLPLWSGFHNWSLLTQTFSLAQF